MRQTVLLFLLLGLCACNGRWAPGYMMTEDGQMVALTDENVRAQTVATIVKQLDAHLGEHWRVEAAIAELPVYESTSSQTPREDNNGWLWPKATATLTLIGDGQVESPMNEEQINAAVRDYLNSKVERPKKNLQVTTTRVVDVARFANRPVTKPVAATEAKAPAATGTPRRYVVQTGDTWADLSLAFYGSPQHWRVIADANQGGELTVGREITIPPKP